MTEPVSALSAPLAPTVPGLPMPALPPKHLRVPNKDPSPLWLLGLLVVSVCVGKAVGANPLVTSAVTVTSVAGVAWWGMRRLKRSIAEQARSIALLQSGDAGGAVAVFDTIARRRFMLRVERATVVFNTGLAQARQGRFEAALSAFSAVHQASALQGQLAVDLGMPLLFADCYARLGDVGAARRWLEVAHKLPSSRTNLVHYTTALVLLREGRFDDAEAIYAAHWSTLENGVVGAHVRDGADVRILRAYTAARRGAPFDDLLEPLRPATSGAADHLAANWPDLQSFLAEAGL